MSNHVGICVFIIHHTYSPRFPLVDARAANSQSRLAAAATIFIFPQNQRDRAGEVKRAPRLSGTFIRRAGRAAAAVA